MKNNYYCHSKSLMELGCHLFHKEFSSYNQTRSLTTANLTADLTGQISGQFFQKKIQKGVRNGKN